MIKCYFDGACEPHNPGGNLGIGAVIFQDNKEIFQFSGFVGAQKSNSNNVAEYLGLERILLFLKDYKCPETKIFIYGDSQLVINQMAKKWRIKSGYYTDHAYRCQKLKNEMGKELLFTWIPREVNQLADDLSKKELLKNKIDFRIQTA